MFDNLNNIEKPVLPKTKLLKLSWRHQFNEFFNKSTLHGVRYIAQSDRPLHERFMWFSFLSVGIVITSIIIVSLWEKFQTSPTITGLDTDFHNWDVQFPAITICPKKPIMDEKLQEYVNSIYGNDTEEEILDKFTQFVTEVASFSYSNIKNFEVLAENKWLPREHLKDIAYKVVYHCEDLLYGCVFKGEPYNCCIGFEPTFTEYGLCYSFNARHVQLDWPWIPENYTKLKTEYVFETDTKLALSFNMENVTKNPLKIFIHSTEDMLIIDSSPQHLWTRRIAKIYFDSKQTYTTDGARQLTIKQRKCVFPDEIPLVTDYIYTFSACMTQCRMDKTRHICGCVPWFYKKIKGYKHCNLDGLACIAKNLEYVLNGLTCSCELGCMNTVYEVEKLQDAQADLIDEPLEISFVSWPMVRYRREVLFGWVDLLGFSLLSGVEILYYFTLRACCMVNSNSEELEKLNEEYEHYNQPEIDLGLKPLWADNEPPKTKQNLNKKIDPFVLPFLP
ncbi:sodium channel protein Nach-like isoform X2 [Daktulosphaira vitifoliae]|uniref:sodium channel protein Nach-like isoform X2 n=1 Tax=Daktulosphaira vitifoliae TaxID=58002 RepID=UPI0021AA2BDB|nr:sodium channel protein Nach-like isoform X2 [Daktulosphaira vitifoliae]